MVLLGAYFSWTYAMQACVFDFIWFNTMRYLTKIRLKNALNYRWSYDTYVKWKRENTDFILRRNLYVNT